MAKPGDTLEKALDSIEPKSRVKNKIECLVCGVRYFDDEDPRDYAICSALEYCISCGAELLHTQERIEG